MNAIVKKAFDKMAELPEPVQQSIARVLLDKIAKWQARREVSSGFASGAAAAWDKDEVKVAARHHLAARRAKK